MNYYTYWKFFCAPRRNFTPIMYKYTKIGQNKKEVAT